MAAGGQSVAPDLVERARTLFRERGVICDSEGFYQHTGECWSDALQMIFLFSDGIKEYTQPYLFKTDIAEGYLKFTQTRFARHFLSEVTRRSCPPKNTLTISKRPNARASGKNAISIAAAGKRQNLKSYKEHHIGGQVEDVNYVLSLFQQAIPSPGILTKKVYITNLKYGLEQLPDGTTKNLSIEQILHDEPVLGVYLEFGSSAGGHALCFYTCGGVDFFYENEYGPIPFSWRVFMEMMILRNSTESSEILFVGKIKKTHLPSGVEFVSNLYPILKKTQGKTIQYFSVFDDSNIFEIKDDEPLTIRLGEYEYRLILSGMKGNSLTGFTTFHLKNIDHIVPAENKTIFGSRIPSLSLYQAIKTLQPELVRKALSEHPEQLANLSININDFPTGYEPGDIILSQLYDKDKIRKEYIIEKDYPLTFEKMIQTLFPTKSTEEIYTMKSRVFSNTFLAMVAFINQKPKILEYCLTQFVNHEICQALHEEIRQIITEGDEEKYKREIEIVNRFCPTSGGRRKTKSKKRSMARKTKRVIRK